MKRRALRAFTLVELLVASVIVILVVVLLSSLVGRVSTIWMQADSRVSSFQSARFAFERITRSLSQATLNPYWDYVDSGGNRRTDQNASSFTPVGYGRMSDQAFCLLPASDFAAQGTAWATFFQAPVGHVGLSAYARLDNLLNAVGFFVEFNSDLEASTQSLKPAFLTEPKWRYRLMELVQPSEDLGVFLKPGREWIKDAMDGPKPRQARPIAENVIALIFQAKTEDGTPLPSSASYVYDSRDINSPNTLNQLPPQVQVTLVTIDEVSAARLATQYETTAPPLVKQTYFKTPASFADDLRNLETDLANHPAKLNYRTFNATVRLESAKWSQ